MRNCGAYGTCQIPHYTLSVQNKPLALSTGWMKSHLNDGFKYTKNKNNKRYRKRKDAQAEEASLNILYIRLDIHLIVTPSVR